MFSTSHIMMQFDKHYFLLFVWFIPFHYKMWNFFKIFNLNDHLYFFVKQNRFIYWTHKSMYAFGLCQKTLQRLWRSFRSSFEEKRVKFTSLTIHCCKYCLPSNKIQSITAYLFSWDTITRIIRSILKVNMKTILIRKIVKKKKQRQISYSLSLCFRSGLLLFDFENATDLNNWQILTDTKRSNGMSKASFVLNKTSTKQSAVFYSSLLPHPKNRACFSGIITFLQINLHKYQYVYFNCLARGRSNNYKFSLGHNNLHYPIPSFDFYFKVGQV